MSNTYHSYSVIIPSFNRADELRELLTSVNELDFPRDQFEIIIADDGSTDNTAQLIADAQKSYEFTLKYSTQQRKGPGAARNLGMEHAQGDFFIFIDSDVILPTRWLTSIDRELQKTQADAFGGPDTYLKSFSPLLKAINYTMTSFISTGGMRGKKGKALAKYYPRSFNMGLSRALWQKIGGFGSLRHGQDIEFSNRIIKSGAQVVFIEDAFVYHKRRTSLKRFFRQVYNWGVARINLYKIDNSMLEPLHAVPAVGALLSLVILVLSPFFEWAAFLLGLGVLGWLVILLFSMLDAILRYKELMPALYIPLVMPMQVYGYGLGFINNYIRRVILGKGEKVGFYKNYYK